MSVPADETAPFSLGTASVLQRAKIGETVGRAERQEGGTLVPDRTVAVDKQRVGRAFRAALSVVSACCNAHYECAWRLRLLCKWIDTHEFRFDPIQALRLSSRKLVGSQKVAIANVVFHEGTRKCPLNTCGGVSHPRSPASPPATLSWFENPLRVYTASDAPRSPVHWILPLALWC